MKSSIFPAESTEVSRGLTAPGTARLDQLEAFLRQDPNNSLLLVDAFDAALLCAQWDRAAFHLRHGQALMPEDLGWRLREGDYWLAQSKYDQALQTLEPLRALPNPPPGFTDALLHNLAYIDFQMGRYAACVERMSVRLKEFDDQQNNTEVVSPALQHLWLRALHRLGDLDTAMSWMHALDERGQLSPQTAGIASLIALDADQLSLARQWSAMALSQTTWQDKPMEALVTQASLALAARDAATAQQMAEKALTVNPKDGRAWSAYAFANLLTGQLETARSHFKQALANMPGHIGTWHGQGWTQLLLQDLDAAELSFRTALALDHNFAETHGGLAVVLALKKNAAASNEHATLAMKLDKSNLSGRYAQALLSGEVSDEQAFHRLAQRLLGDRGAPLGGLMSDVLSQRVAKPTPSQKAPD